MTAAQDDWPARRRVWEALADLYLDTNATLSYPHIARVLASSPYTLSQLQKILRHEVHPVLMPNLLSVAGEWAGFDSDWLAARIRGRLALPRWRRPFGCVLCGYARRHWGRLAPLVRAARNDASSP